MKPTGAIWRIDLIIQNPNYSGPRPGVVPVYTLEKYLSYHCFLGFYNGSSDKTTPYDTKKDFKYFFLCDNQDEDYGVISESRAKQYFDWDTCLSKHIKSIEDRRVWYDIDESPQPLDCRPTVFIVKLKNGRVIISNGKSYRQPNWMWIEIDAGGNEITHPIEDSEWCKLPSDKFDREIINERSTFRAAWEARRLEYNNKWGEC